MICRPRQFLVACQPPFLKSRAFCKASWLLFPTFFIPESTDQLGSFPVFPSSRALVSLPAPMTKLSPPSHADFAVLRACRPPLFLEPYVKLLFPTSSRLIAVETACVFLFPTLPPFTPFPRPPPLSSFHSPGSTNLPPCSPWCLFLPPQWELSLPLFFRRFFSFFFLPPLSPVSILPFSPVSPKSRILFGQSHSPDPSLLSSLVLFNAEFVSLCWRNPAIEPASSPLSPPDKHPGNKPPDLFLFSAPNLKSIILEPPPRFTEQMIN